MATVRLEWARAGWNIWLQWVLANAVAGAVAMTVTGAMILAGRLTPAVVVVDAGPLMGASLGLAQAYVLQRRIEQATLWLIASIAGGVMLGILGYVAGGAVGGPLGGAVLGASLGVVQWLVLRNQVGSKAHLYLPASIASFALALTVGEAIGFTVGGFTGWLVGGMMFGIVAGAITGTALVWSLHPPIVER